MRAAAYVLGCKPASVWLLIGSREPVGWTGCTAGCQRIRLMHGRSYARRREHSAPLAGHMCAGAGRHAVLGTRGPVQPSAGVLLGCKPAPICSSGISRRSMLLRYKLALAPTLKCLADAHQLLGYQPASCSGTGRRSARSGISRRLARSGISRRRECLTPRHVVRSQAMRDARVSAGIWRAGSTTTVVSVRDAFPAGACAQVCADVLDRQVMCSGVSRRARVLAGVLGC